MRIEYILNGKPVKVKPEHEQEFLQNNPTATKSTVPGKSQEAGQPQQNQKQKDTELQSGDGSSDSVKKFKLNNKIVKVDSKNVDYFKKNNPEAEELNYRKGSFLDVRFNPNFSDIKWSAHENEDIPKDGGFFEDLGVALKQGGGAGMSVEEAWNVYGKGASISDEKLQDYIKAVKRMDVAGPTQEQVLFQKVQQDAGGGIWGTLKGIAYNPGYAPQFMLSSLATMVTSLEAEQTWGMVGAGSGAGFLVGSGVGAAAGSIGGPIGTALGYVGGGGTGAVGGAVGGLIAGMETGLTLTDLLKDELKTRGIDPVNGFNEDNIRDVLEDKDAIDRIKSRSLARGLTIGMVEGLTLGISRGVGSALAKTATASKVALATASTEMAGGFVGEVAGQAAAGQEIDLGEATLEAIGEAKGIVNSADIIASARGREYVVNGQAVTRDKVLETLNNKQMTTAEKTKILGNIKIKNDENLQNVLDGKLNDALIEVGIDSKVIGIEDRKRLVELQKKKLKAEEDAKKTGVFKVIGAAKTLENIDNEINEITTAYEGVHGNTKDVKLLEQDAVDVAQDLAEQNYLQNLKKLDSTIKFAEDNQQAIGKDVIVAESDVDAQAYHDMAIDEFNSKIEDQINNVKSNEQLTAEEKSTQIEELNSKKLAAEDVAGADGFIVGGVIVINKDVSASTKQINVGGHEVLHGVIDKHLDSLSEVDRTKLISDFKNTLTDSQRKYIQRKLEARKAAGETDLNLETTSEWLTTFSDGITKGDIAFDESLFNKVGLLIQDILRKFNEFSGGRLGVKEFADGRQVYNFMKDYQKSINKGRLSRRAVKLAGGGTQATTQKKSVSVLEEKADVQEMSEAIDRHVPKGITTNEEFLTPDRTRMSPYDRVMQEILIDNTLDGYINRLVIADKSLGGVTNRSEIVENIKFELIKKIRSEYKPIVDGNYRSLFSYIYGAAAQKGKGGIAFKSLLNVKKTYAKRVDRGAASLEVKTSEGIQTRQVEDVTEEASIETEDLSISKQAKQIRDAKKRKQQGLLEEKQTDKFVNKEYNHSKETNNKVEGVIERSNYDVNKPYEAIKEDMMAQENKNAKVSTDVNPTGVLFDAFEVIARNVFGVNPKAIMAKQQNLSKSENESGRQTIANRAKKEGSLKKYLEKILPDRNYNPKTKKSIGTWAGLIRSLYTDAVNENGKPIRIDNIKGRVLNLEKFTEAQLAEMFGLTPDYKLLPYKKGFKDGMIKGAVVAESVLTINQAARVAAKQPAAPISIGKPKTMFSNSPGEYIKNSYRAATRDIAAELEKRFGSKFLMEGDAKNRPAQLKQIYDEKTGETFGQARDRVANNFVDAFPRFRDMLMRGLIGGVSRSTYGTITNFNKKVKPAPKGVEVIEVKRNKYTVPGRKQKANIVKFLKSVFKSEKSKLKNLKDFFVAIQDYLQENPKDTWLFLEMLRDSTSAGMGSIIRILAPTKFYTVDQKTKKPILNKDVVEEHTDPQNQIGTALMYAAINNNVNEVFSVIGGSYMQGSVLITEDNKINNVIKDPKKRSLSRDMPDIYFDKIIPRLKNGSLKLADGMASVVRLAVQGVNLNQLMLVDTNKTIAEYFGVGLDTNNMTNNQINRMVAAQNQLVVMQLTGEITKAKATKAIKTISNTKFKLTKKKAKALIDSKDAAVNRIKFSKSPEERGMSTFDFDDTLAKTKSGVRVTLPNLDGEPKPKRKVIFLAGGAGSGKGNVVRKLGLEKQGFKIVNQDISLEWLKKNHGLPESMNNLTKEQRSTLGKLGHQARGIARRKMMKYQGDGNGVVVDGTGASSRNMQKLVDEFEAKGYDVSMVYVETSLDVALQRNKARQERSLLDVIVKRNHESVQNNKSTFKEMFGKRFMEINTDNLTMDSPMPETLTNKVDDFVFSYEKQRIDAEEFATRGSEILEQGGKFDFSEFNEVVEGAPGPLLNKAIERAKKYGTKDMFVLTARPAESAKAIQEFLKSQGLNIPIENITGLADSTGEAKAQWMLEKFAEGYNNLYFVDDAFQNVKAVQDVLNQLDAKSQVVQAKAKFSKSASQEFNQIIEESQGTQAGRVISQAEAKRLGRHKGWWRIFVPPSAEDFKGLLYRFLGKGKVGDQHMSWFKDNLLNPFAKGIRSWNIYKQNMVNEYKELKKNFKDVTKSLNNKVPGTTFTVDAAVRVYLWKKAGFDIPGLDIATETKLNDYVLNDIEVRNFADALSEITQTKDGYVKPSSNWSIQTVATDLNNIVNKVGRKQFLAEYLANVEAIFTPENVNKIEAIYGTSFKEALENILYRMENGRNRNRIYDRNSNRLLNWVNGSIGAIMFFNMRSAILQTISTVNFINWSDNNVFKASAAFANQKQFWSDFAMLFNSPQLKQRRSGLQIDVSASELSKAFSDGKGTPQSVLAWLLEKGFTPTQIADSFAIAFGGSSFIRNRIKTYMKQGMTEGEAKEKAMLDFQEIAEETQQSSREDLISQQQASVLGRLVLAFQNVTMQYTRLMKKSLSDIVNRRGDMKTNISKVIYYGAVQNIIFASLQSALLFMLWGDNEDEEVIDEKAKRTLNSAFDSLLRGTGIYGAAVAAIKNTILRWQVEKEKGYGRRDDGRIILEALNFSPPIGSKLRKIYSAIKTESYNMDEISDEIGFRVENPKVYALASIIEAATNLPLQRLVRKANNLEEAITSQHETWQRVALALGWDMWSLGIRDEELEQAKKDAKSNIKDRRIEDKRKKKEDEKKDMQKKGFKKIRCSGTRSNGERCKIVSDYTKAKTFKCVHHMGFKDGMDRDGDGLKEYRCTAKKTNGKRCKNKTENKNKKCYAHQ